MYRKADVAHSSGEYVERVITKDTPVVRFKPFNGSSLNPADGKYSMYVRFPSLHTHLPLITTYSPPPLSLMIDPDLTHPNDRLSGQVRHWLQPGLVFSDGGDEGMAAKATEKAVTEYLECAPGPPVSRFYSRSVQVDGCAAR